MATEAQIAANRSNAQASTGPATAAGRSRSSQNAISSGLYSRGDFVLPGEQPLYDEFCAGFQTDLQPEGAVEQTLSAEIIHSAWRLRRCSAIASGFTGSLDPMVDSAAAPAQQAVDRARNDAHRTFQRAISELRRLQTEREFRTQSLPDDIDLTTFGLASFRDLAPALMTDTRRQQLLQNLRGAADRQTAHDTKLENLKETARLQAIVRAAISQPNPLFTNGTQSIGRNSPCHCGSGMKFKRCCGTGAPAVLNLAA